MTNNPLELVHLNEHESHVLQQLQGGSEHIRGKPVITARGLMLHHPQMLKNVLDHHKKHMAAGGKADHEHLRKLAGDGRFGDTKLAYVDKHLQNILDKHIGKSINPKDGKHEYFLGALLGSIGRFVMPAVRAVGGLFSRGAGAAANAARAGANAVGRTATRAGNAIAQPFRSRSAARLASQQRGRSGAVPVPRFGAAAQIAGQIASGGAMGTAMAMPQLIEMGRRPAQQPMQEPMPMTNEPYQSGGNVSDYYSNLLSEASRQPQQMESNYNLPSAGVGPRQQPMPGARGPYNPNTYFADQGAAIGDYMGHEAAPYIGRGTGAALGARAGYNLANMAQEGFGVPNMLRAPINYGGGAIGGLAGFGIGAPIANYTVPPIFRQAGRTAGAGLDLGADMMSNPGNYAPSGGMAQFTRRDLNYRPGMMEKAKNWWYGRPNTRYHESLPSNSYTGGAYPGEIDPLNGFNPVFDELD